MIVAVRPVSDLYRQPDFLDQTDHRCRRAAPSQSAKPCPVAVIVNFAYLLVIAYSYPTTIGQGHTFRLGFYRLPNIVAEAVFWWWFVGSMLAFVLVIVFGIADRAVGAAAWVYRSGKGNAQLLRESDIKARTHY